MDRSSFETYSISRESFTSTKINSLNYIILHTSQCLLNSQVSAIVSGEY